jgi:DNA-binding XRE family transcriptional regulator
MVKKKLADYLDMFSWSQADLARAADVSPHCIRRALRGEPIARRNAAKIAAALTERLNGQGGNGHIGVQSIQGLQVADLHHKKKKEQSSDEAQDGVD